MLPAPVPGCHQPDQLCFHQSAGAPRNYKIGPARLIDNFLLRADGIQGELFLSMKEGFFADVQAGTFPSDAESYHMDEESARTLCALMRNGE